MIFTETPDLTIALDEVGATEAGKRIFFEDALHDTTVGLSLLGFPAFLAQSTAKEVNFAH